MQNLTPEQAQTVLQLTLPALKNEHRITKTMIEAIPADKADYRPHANSKTASDLAWHIASAENMFLDATASGEFHFEKTNRPESIRTSADIAQWYAQNFEANFDRLTGLSPDQLVRTVNFRDLFNFPAVMYLELGLKHSIHHRGQLSVYLRPMGAKVPNIYGESFDAAEARKAAEASS
jgi:uncharacterized damage-inducible protein DinB